jgi:dihydrolipoamide dehydrogenase
VEPRAGRIRGVPLGAVAVGFYAEEWVSEIGFAIRAETPPSVLADVMPAPPAYGEAVEPPLRELSGASEEGISHE